MFQEVKQAVSLDQTLARYLPHVELRPAGVNLVGRCPFHSEKTASFTVNIRKQIWKCFGCGAGGTVIDLVMHAANVTNIEAAKMLAQDFGVWVPGLRDKPQFKSAEQRRREHIKRRKARAETKYRMEKQAALTWFDSWCHEAYKTFALLYRNGERALRNAEDPFALADITHALPLIGHYMDLLLFGSEQEKLDLFKSEEVCRWL